MKKAKTVTKSGLTPGPEPTLEAKTDIPEELVTVWDDEVARTFRDLRPQQQDFVIAYIATGNGAESYRRAYNKLASDHLASVAGSRLLASVGVGAILDKFTNRKTEALFRVTKTYFDLTEATKPNFVQDKDGQWSNAGDTPEWKARKDGADGLSKIYGLNSPEKVEDDRLTALLTHMNRMKEPQDGKEARQTPARKDAGTLGRSFVDVARDLPRGK